MLFIMVLNVDIWLLLLMYLFGVFALAAQTMSATLIMLMKLLKGAYSLIFVKNLNATAP